ncbi:hypothetical protein FA15DRAFT_660251 [Coprinopsis marcescibilis]|uniref:Uncharacterized protein n=1 Tax=Coprinopsis marcescibilis TaxID=230819 RepID=A0A5C3KG60_COPMA|nr:hypothetical protein FA15DRAFT_660251 [Coprinopsis marcescibilis]
MSDRPTFIHHVGTSPKNILRLLYASLALSLLAFGISVIYRGYSSLRIAPVVSLITFTFAIVLTVPTYKVVFNDDVTTKADPDHTGKKRATVLRAFNVFLTFTLSILWFAIWRFEAFVANKTSDILSMLPHRDPERMWQEGIFMFQPILVPKYVPSPISASNWDPSDLSPEDTALWLEWVIASLTPFARVIRAESHCALAQFGVLLAIGTLAIQERRERKTLRATSV